MSFDHDGKIQQCYRECGTERYRSLEDTPEWVQECVFCHRFGCKFCICDDKCLNSDVCNRMKEKSGIWLESVSGEEGERKEGYEEKLFTDKTEIKILFDYPLKRSVVFSFENENGFTRREFINCIRRGYKKIYDEEKQTSLIEIGQFSEYCLNRNTTNGTYGICGHEIEDLCIEGVEYNSNTDTYELYIGS